MIKRYENRDIKRIWSLSNKKTIWEKIELNYLNKILSKKFNLKKEISLLNRNDELIERYERECKHEFVAFLKEMSERLSSIYESIYPQCSSYIHYGLTSSDVIDTTFSIQIKKSINHLLQETHSVHKELNKLINTHKGLKAVGRTHGKHAEEINYVSRFKQFKCELDYAENELIEAKKNLYGKMTGPVGTSSLVYAEEALQTIKDFDLKPAPFSTQIVPRIYYNKVIFACVSLMSCYERFCTQLRLSAIDELDELQEGFSVGQAGSSAMPHKNNPIISENITGLARLVKRNLFTSIENNNLWFERDISHSSVERIIYPESFHLCVTATKKMHEELLPNLVVNTSKISFNLKNAEDSISSHKALLNESLNTNRFNAYTKVQKKYHNKDKNVF